ncbi:MAG: TolB family protein [bacterium]
MQRTRLVYYAIGLWIFVALTGFPVSRAVSMMIAPDDPISVTIRVMFDLKKADSLTWDGTARITEGTIDSIKGIGFEHTDKLYTNCNSWRCLLTKKPCGPCGEVVTSKGILLGITSPPSATVVLATKAGNFCIPMHELSLGKVVGRYDGRLQIGLAPRDFLLTTHSAEDDAPSIDRDGSGTIWVCWISHQGGKDSIAAKRYREGAWSETMEVSAKPGMYCRPSIASDPDGGMWVIWPAYEKDNWDLYARRYNGSRWTGVTRITSDPSNDINQTVATDPWGAIWVCWESSRKGNADLYMKRLFRGEWSEEIPLTSHPANDRQPAIGIDGSGTMYISWSRFSDGSYSILLKQSPFDQGEEMVVASSDDLIAHPSIACTQGESWIAWDESKRSRQTQTGGIGTEPVFYARRRIGIRCVKHGALFEPVCDMEESFPFPLKQHAELPHLTIDGSGKVWVFFHNYIAGLPHSVWRIYGMYYAGNEWSQPILFPHYTWKDVDSVASSQDSAGNLWIAWSSDSRDLGSSFLSDRDIYVGHMNLRDYARRPPEITPVEVETSLASRSVSPIRQEPGYDMGMKDKADTLVWGTLYQPNNIKGYTGLDGFVAEIYRMVSDVACLDFLAIGNYTDPENNAYIRWLGNKANLLFSEPDQFMSLTIPQDCQSDLYAGFNRMATGEKPLLIGAFTRNLTKESIETALQDKRAYIASDRIFLDARILVDHAGGALKTQGRIPRIDVSVVGTDELYQIDIYRNENCIYSRSPQALSARFTFFDMQVPEGTSHYAVHVIQKNGEEARTLPGLICSL